MKRQDFIEKLLSEISYLKNKGQANNTSGKRRG